MVEDILKRAVFHNLTGIHDGDGIADFRHDAEIVGDHDHGHIILAFKIADHIQHLGLDGDIEGGGWLIRDQDLG